MSDSFRALVVSEVDGRFERSVSECRIADLPAGDVLIRVHYSSLNYKDALSASGHRGVTRRYPHTPGVDAAGIVAHSSHPSFKAGDEVICTGHDLGMNTPGGFGEFIRVPAAWVVPLPDGLSMREAMMLGTAGFTAALSLYRLQQHGFAATNEELLVTGATGGVGTVAVALASHLGYRVIAATGKAHERKFLEALGAREVMARDALDDPARPLLPGRWPGAIDTAGGNLLSAVLRSLKPRGIATTCGNVVSHELHTNVYPFILRGVVLVGIDSANTEMEVRRTLWKRLASDWKLPQLPMLAREVSVESLGAEIDRMLKGAQVGRILVRLID
jgi:acrylyl-CoA reductase (NADPH)